MSTPRPPTPEELRIAETAITPVHVLPWEAACARVTGAGPTA